METLIGPGVWVSGVGVWGLGLRFLVGPYGSFGKLGVPYFGVLIIGILLFEVLY